MALKLNPMKRKSSCNDFALSGVLNVPLKPITPSKSEQVKSPVEEMPSDDPIALIEWGKRNI